MPCPSRRFGLLLAVLCVPAAVAQAREPFVFAAFNQAALARHAPLPVPGPGAADVGSRLVLDWTNEYVIKQAGGESLRLDGESLRLGLHRAWRVGEFVLGAELPILVTGGGVLDSGIETWHDWFGLPNGGREQRPQDEYRYVYVRDGETVFDVDEGGAALGDVRLSAARCGPRGGCWRAQLQLPTADADRFLGGGLGVSAWHERGYALDAAGRWTGVVAAGAGFVDGNGPLESQRERVVPFGWLSLGYALTDTLEAGVQYYGHGPLYDDSRLDVLTKPGGALAFGFRYRAAGGSAWRFGLQEDPVTDSSPDFVIHLAVDWRG